MRTAIVVKKGEPLSDAIISGKTRMSERHVWWVVNSGSRGVRELLQQSCENSSNNETDYGTNNNNNNEDKNNNNDRSSSSVPSSSSKPITLPLIAAYNDPRTQTLKELPLTRCIEIWGHAPFGASEAEVSVMADC